MRHLPAVHVWRAHHVMGNDWSVCDGRPRRAGVAHSWRRSDVACYGCGLLDAGGSVRHLRGAMPARCLLTAALAALLCHGGGNARMSVLKSGSWTYRAPRALIRRGDVHRHTLTWMADPSLTYERRRPMWRLVTDYWRRVLALRCLEHLLLLLLVGRYKPVLLQVGLLVLSRNLLLLLLLCLCEFGLLHLPRMPFSQPSFLNSFLLQFSSPVEFHLLLLQSLRMILLHLLLVLPLRFLFVLYLDVF